MLSSAAVIALLALAAGISGLAVYWIIQFRALLPLRRRLRELQRQASVWSREVSALHEVADTVAARSLQDQSTLGAIVSIAAHAVEADLAAVLLLDESAGELATQPGTFGVPAEDHYRVPLTDDGSASVRVFKTGKAFWTGHAQTDPGVIARYAKLWKVHSLLIVPIRREGHSIGVLRLGSFKRDFFTTEHAELISVIAEEAAVLVETAVLNRRLAETAEQLKAMNRMKDEFVSTVSHEFKTPLTTISGFVSVMLDGETGPLGDQQKRFLSVVQGAVKRMNDLVEELLDLSKLEGGAPMEFSSVDLGRLIAASVEQHQARADEGRRTIMVRLPPVLPAARADERWLGLVIDNLVSNAVKFTRRDGYVKISAEDKGEFILIRVEDDGIGVAADELERIFERFHRAANAAESGASGTGLGLAIAKEIVQRHGGKIWCESELNRGSKFQLVIPAVRTGQLTGAR